MTHDLTAHVVIDPARNFGRPSLPGGPAVDVVAGMVWAGDPVNSVVDEYGEYGITRAQVLVACWYAVEYGPRRRYERWSDWAQHAEPHLQHGTYDLIPDPPTRGGDQ